MELGTTRVQPGARITSFGAVIFPNSSILEVEIPVSPANGTTNITIELFSYNFSIGSFVVARSVNTFDNCTLLGTPVVRGKV